MLYLPLDSHLELYISYKVVAVLQVILFLCYMYIIDIFTCVSIFYTGEQSIGNTPVEGL